MREAFLQALDELETAPHGSPVDRHALQVLRGAATASGGERAVSPDELSRLSFRARKLGRSWASYTHAAETDERDVAVLQEHWATLAVQLGAIVPSQKAQVLAAFVSGMALDDPRLSEQKRSYLLRQRDQRPAAFAGFCTERSPLNWLSASAYLVHALEELVGVSQAEREQLHRLLVSHLAAAQFSYATLVTILSQWLVLRHEPDWQTGSWVNPLVHEAAAQTGT